MSDPQRYDKLMAKLKGLDPDLRMAGYKLATELFNTGDREALAQGMQELLDETYILAATEKPQEITELLEPGPRRERRAIKRQAYLKLEAVGAAAGGFFAALLSICFELRKCLGGDEVRVNLGKPAGKG